MRGLVRPEYRQFGLAGLLHLGSVRWCRREVGVEVVTYLVSQPKQEADEDDDFEDDELDLSQTMAELSEALEWATSSDTSLPPPAAKRFNSQLHILADDDCGF